MELKEFSHKGEAIEKEIKKEFQFMGRTIKKRRVGLIIAAAGVIAVIAVALFIHSQQFDVWDYITISYEGANGYAKPVFTLNKDKLYNQLLLSAVLFIVLSTAASAIGLFGVFG